MSAPVVKQSLARKPGQIAMERWMAKTQLTTMSESTLAALNEAINETTALILYDLANSFLERPDDPHGWAYTAGLVEGWALMISGKEHSELLTSPASEA